MLVANLDRDGTQEDREFRYFRFLNSARTYPFSVLFICTLSLSPQFTSIHIIFQRSLTRLRFLLLQESSPR